MLAKLRAKDVDLVCGSVVIRPDGDGGRAETDPGPGRRRRPGRHRRHGVAPRRVSLLTNLPPEELPGPTVGSSELRTLPLVVSASGLMAGCCTRGSAPTTATSCASPPRSTPSTTVSSCCVRGCCADACWSPRGRGRRGWFGGRGWFGHRGRFKGRRRWLDADTSASYEHGRGLRAVDLVNDTGPCLEVLLGAFTRRGERASYEPSHPLNLLWDALALENARWRREQRWPTSGLEPDPFEPAPSHDLGEF
ncbi:hypothetical protein NKH77_27320 [Streptomyces sp. M19]